MGEFIKGIVDDHADSLCEQGVRLNVKATASDARALIDRMQMTRVFTNIISNSCKYNEQRPLDIDISLECRDQMYLKVADHGRGVPEALLPKLFESFYKQMREQGMFMAPSAFEANMLSFAHSDEDFAKALDAARRVKF